LFYPKLIAFFKEATVYDRNRFRKENKAIAQEYKEFPRISYQTLTTEDKKLIRSFDVAARGLMTATQIR
jgi:hypothetical protein